MGCTKHQNQKPNPPPHLNYHLHHLIFYIPRQFTQIQCPSQLQQLLVEALVVQQQLQHSKKQYHRLLQLQQKKRMSHNNKESYLDQKLTPVNAGQALRAIDSSVYANIKSQRQPLQDQIVYSDEGQHLYTKSIDAQLQRQMYEEETFGASVCISSWHPVQQIMRKGLSQSINLIQGEVTNVQDLGNVVEVEYRRDGECIEMQCDLLIAADGYRSSVRSFLSKEQIQGSLVQFKGRVLIWASLSIKSNPNLQQVKPLNGTYYIRGEYFSTIRQTEDDRIILVSSDTVENLEARGQRFDPDKLLIHDISSGQTLAKKDALLPQYRNMPEDVQKYIRAIQEEDIFIRAGYFHSSETWTPSYFGSGRVVFLGDSAHTFMPNGQGADQVFEDAYHLAKIVKKEGVIQDLGGKLGAVRQERVLHILRRDERYFQNPPKTQDFVKHEEKENVSPQRALDEFHKQVKFEQLT